MKNLLRVLAFTLISFSSYAQLPSFPNNTSQSNTSTKHTFLGPVASRGYQIYYVADTAAANLVQYFKFTSDLLIKAGDNLYMRSRDKSRWILIGGNVTGTPPPDIYYGVDSVKYDTASSTLCVWSFGIANCYQISTNAPPNTTGVDSVIVTDNQVCQYVGGVPTCYTITSIVNNNQYITNTYIYSGVDSTTYDSATRTYCVYSNGIANCQIINGTVLPPSSNSSVDSVVVTNNQICSWSGGIATCYTIESVINNNEYITNIINNFIDSSITTVNNPTCAPEWNSGNVVVDSAFVARNTFITFHINCVEYTVDASVFTVPGSGSLPFYLAIYADTNRNMGWYVGGTNPLEIPGILDPQKEILLKVYYIPAFGDTIGGIKTVWVYREGNDNYAYDNKRTVTSTFDSLYTLTPFTGNSLRISAMTAGQYFTWDLPASHTPTELTDWSAHLRIASSLPKGVKWQISLYSGNSLATSNSIVITDGAYGYSRTAAGVFQFLSGRLSEFNFILPSYDRIRVTFIGSAAVNQQWDDVRLQADAPPVNVTGFVKTVNNVGGSNIFLKVGDILRLNADSSQYELVDSLSGVTLRTVPTFLKYYVGLVDTCLIPIDIDAKHWTLTLNPHCRGSGTGGNVLAYINGTMVNDSTLRLYRDNGDSSDFVIPGGAGSVSSPIDTTNFVQKATTITINGTAQNLSTNGTWNVGTVTSVAKGYGVVADGTITTTGTINVDSSVIATRTRLTNELSLKLNISDTALMLLPYRNKINQNTDSLIAHNLRIISLRDSVISHNTRLNTKQDIITLTTTGSSGPATLSGATLNIPQYSGVGGGTGVQKAQVPYVIKGTDTVSRRWNVLDYAPTGYVMGTTDATVMIKAAIDACNAGGGGTVFFPVGRYIISSALDAHNNQITIPQPLTTPTRVNIRLEGEAVSNTSGTGGLLGGSTANAPTVGAILYSTITTGATGAAVIGSILNSFNFNGFEVFNLGIVVKHNPSGSGPVVGGINWKWGTNFMFDRVQVVIDTSGYFSTLPSNDVSGIETPNDAGGENYSIRNSNVQGFRSGYKIGEHVVLDNANAMTCYYGINFKTGTHTVASVRSGIFWCPYALYVSAGNCPPLSLFKIDVEWMQIGKWYDAINTIKDSANRAVGQMIYNITAAGAGKDNTKFSISGGANLKITSDEVGWLRANALIPGMGTYSSTYNNVLDMSSRPTFAAVDFIFPGGSSSAGTGVFRAAQASAIGTNDIFFQLGPLTTAGYAVIEGLASTGTVISTAGVAGALNSTQPILISHNRAEKWRFASTGALSNTGSNGTAYLQFKAGLATASNAPLKFTAGTQLTTPESGVMETITGNELKYSTSTTANSRGFVQLARIQSTATGVTAGANDNTIVLTATGQTVTLPTAIGIQGRVYTIKLSASGTGTVATTSSQTIDGSTTYSLSAQYKYVTVQSDNANWQIIANN